MKVDAILRDRKTWADVAQSLNVTVAGIVAHHLALRYGEVAWPVEPALHVFESALASATAK